MNKRSISFGTKMMGIVWEKLFKKIAKTENNT